MLLTADELHALLSRRLGGDLAALEPLGAGVDHVAYTAADLVVRAAKAPDPTACAALEREARLLAALRPRLPVAVPEPVLVDPAACLLVCRRIPGVALLDTPAVDPRGLAASLARLLTALHSTPPAKAAALAEPDPYPLAAWRDDAEDHYRAVAEDLPDAARRGVETFLDTPPPADSARLALCHNDLGAEHLLIDPATGALTGVIDWADAALADPCRDLGRLHRDLGPAVLQAILNRYEHDLDDADRRRIGFYAGCALLEDLVHGLQTNDPRYSNAALANLDHTFPAPP